MDLVSLRRDTRSVVNTEGARSGFKARGHAGKQMLLQKCCEGSTGLTSSLA